MVSYHRHVWLIVFIAAIFSSNTLVSAAVVCEYYFEEGVGTASGDTSGNGNNINWLNGPAWVSGHGGSSRHSLRFDGTTYIEAADSASLDSISSKFSISAWINIDANTTRDTIVWKQGVFRVWKQNSNLMVSLAGVTTSDVAVITGLITNGTWLHVAVTYDGMRIKSYLNGVWQKSITASGSLSSSNSPLYIGYYTTAPHLKGSLDNVFIYNHALTASEVVTEMNRDIFAPSSLTIVSDASAASAIVIPDSSAYVVQEAASQLQEYIHKSTGLTLGIYSESSKPTSFSGLIYLGSCNATAAAGIQASYLSNNSYIIRNFGGSLFLSGKDGSGTAYNDTTFKGTMFAVYEFLGEQLGVRWLWPGETGKYVPSLNSITASNLNQIIVPQLIHSRLRSNGTYLLGYQGWADPNNRDKFVQDTIVWTTQHQLGRPTSFEYGHAFEDYYSQYGTSHPEYFNRLPDGTIRSDPYYCNGLPQFVSMNVSSTGLHTQIIDNWLAERTSTLPWINGCENDTSGKDTSAGSMVWDVEPLNFAATYGCEWTQRLSYAANAFNQQDPAWNRFLGPLSDRYVQFWQSLRQEAVNRGENNAVVIGLAYANYSQPPVAKQGALDSHFIVGIVPGVGFPWTAAKREAFCQQWDGWFNTGATLFMRPNYTLDGHNFPIYYADALGEDFYYAYSHGMIATDFDSLTGQFAAQGPNLYLLARIHREAAKSPDTLIGDVNSDFTVDIDDLKKLADRWLQTCLESEVWCEGTVNFNEFAALASNWLRSVSVANRILEEYYGAFGPAEDAVRAYFNYLKNVSENATVSPDYTKWYTGADQIFTPEVMTQAESLLAAAQMAASGNSNAEAKVSFLQKGLTNAELTLAAQHAWQAYISTGDLQGWQTAISALDSFRASVEDEEISNMAVLYSFESNVWDRDVTPKAVVAGTIMAVKGDKIYEDVPGCYNFYNANQDNCSEVVLDLGTPKTIDKITFRNRVDTATNYSASSIDILVAPNELNQGFMPYNCANYTTSVYSGTLSPSMNSAGVWRQCDITNVTARYFLLRVKNNFVGTISSSNQSVYIDDVDYVSF